MYIFMLIPIRFLILFLLLIGSLQLSANITTTRGGDMWVQEYSPGFFRLKGMLLLTDAPTNFDSVQVDWGDALTQVICLAGYPSTVTPQGVRVSFNLTHVYSPGTYNLLLTCGKRVPWILNMDNSGSTDFKIVSSFIYDPNSGMNSLPLGDTLNYEVELVAGVTNTIAHTVVDFEGDSVRFYRLTPAMSINFQQPEVAGGGTFTYTSGSGNFTWDPQVPGLYSALFGIYEYRQNQNGNWVTFGVHAREIILDVGSVSGVGTNSAWPQLSLFPNPNTGIFTINGLQAGDCVRIENASGSVVQAATVTEASLRIDLSAISPGVYFVIVDDTQRRFGLRSARVMICE
jgi:Secretion system C-terminal sorting domain